METDHVLVQKRNPISVDELPEEARLSRRPDKPLARERAVVQLVRKQNGRVYLRTPPKTRASPTPAQVETRIKFGEAARKTKGLSGAAERARQVGDEVRGFRSTYKRPEPLPQWAKDLIGQGYDRERVLAAVEAWGKKERP